MSYLILLLVTFLFSFPAVASESYADLVEKIIPSVVNVSTETESNVSEENIDDITINQSLKGRESLGSGFFIRRDGYILTNNHVIKEAKKINITTVQGKVYEAKLIGADTPSDLAILKIDEEDNSLITPVVFGDAEAARVGDVVLTFGNPYGLGISVSQGIISAKSRTIGLGEQQYIQTDAAINQGNSGGPMFNLEGEVIGVNSAIFMAQGTTGVGFSLPSNMANWIANQIIDKGKVRRGWIGIEVSFGIDRYTDKSGFVITEINENSHAFKEGLRVGDIIISYNDKIAQDVNAFRIFVETMNPGQALRLKIISSGEEMRHVIRVQDIPADILKSATNKALSESRQFSYQENDNNVVYISELYVAVQEVMPRGLAIVKIEKKSPFYDKGVKVGDVILEADQMDIYSPDNLLESIRNALVDGERSISMLIQGIDNSFYVNVTPVNEND